MADFLNRPLYSILSLLPSIAHKGLAINKGSKLDLLTVLESSQNLLNCVDFADFQLYSVLMFLFRIYLQIYVEKCESRIEGESPLFFLRMAPQMN